MYVRADTGLSAKAADPCLPAANCGGSGNGCGPLQTSPRLGKQAACGPNLDMCSKQLCYTVHAVSPDLSMTYGEVQFGCCGCTTGGRNAEG